MFWRQLPNGDLRVKSFLVAIFFTIVAQSVSAEAQMADKNIKREAIEKKYQLEWPGQLPRGLRVYAPQDGGSQKRPILLYFHSTDFPVFLDRQPSAPFGLYYESQLIQKLVSEKGFVVIAPDASYNYGSFAWQTNLRPYFFDFESSEDYLFVETIFKNIENYYPFVNRSKIFVGGLSSGGYMASRLSILPEFAKWIRGTFIHSGSYASCISYYCVIPEEIPAFHPPTLLIASKLDPLVPKGTIEIYYQRLIDAKIPTEIVSYPSAWHGMYQEDVELISEWLTSF
jgi:acetyl esterase/lipase